MTTTTVDQPISPSGIDRDIRTSVQDRFVEIVDQSPTQIDAYATGFFEIAKMFQANWGLLEIQIAGRTITRQFRGDEMDGTSILAITEHLASDARIEQSLRSEIIENGDQPFGFFSFPVLGPESASAIGTVTMAIQLPSVAAKEMVAGQVEKVATTYSEVLSEFEQKCSASAAAEKQLDSLIKATRCGSLTQLGMELANGFCTKLGCEQTAIGVVEDQRAKMLSISGVDTITQNSPAVVEIRQAMEECLDHNQTIVVQNAQSGDDAKSSSFLLHRHWHETTGGSSVCSLPIQFSGKTVGVLALRSPVDQPFSHRTLETAKTLVDSFAPSLMLVKKADRTLKTHFSQTVRDNIHEILFGKNIKRRIGAGILVALVAWFLLGWMPYRPIVPCTVQPVELQHLVAPFEGRIAATYFASGDRVKRGDIILEFDLRQFRLEKIALDRELKMNQIARDQAIVEGRTSDAAVFNAKCDLLLAQLQLVNQKLMSGVMKAEFDGVIVRGDLRSQIGQVVQLGTPLLQVAPSENKMIKLEIPQSLAAHIQNGASGTFVSSSRPGKSYRCKINRLTPSIEPMTGKSAMIAEAELETSADQVLVGVEGAARINSGWKPVWWITTHKFLDGLRLNYWL